MGSVGKSGGSYFNDYVKNTPWIDWDNPTARKLNTESFNSMSNSEQYFYSLSNEEQRALVGMQMNTWAINEYLRNNGSGNDRLDNDIKTLNSAIDKYNLTNDIVVYRGASQEEISNLLNEKETTSFKSTTSDLRTAQNFARSQGNGIIEYHISKGTKGVADVDGAPGANESEWLLRGGVKYKSVTVDNGRIIVNI